MSNRPNKLGVHLSTAQGWQKMFQEAQQLECTTAQIFVKNARQWKSKLLSADSVAEFKNAYGESCVFPVIAHASYLINLASINPLIEANSCASLSNELELCSQLSIPYLVLHPGSYATSTPQEAINKFGININSVLEKSSKDVMILLENSAGQGSSLGKSFEELALLRNEVPHKDLIGFCFDTCHAFAAGYSFNSPATYNALWDSFDTILGLKNLKVIHLNDSKNGQGSCVDRHAPIAEGALGLEAFRLLLNDKRFKDIPKILETPKKSTQDDQKNLSVIRSLIK